MKNKKAEQAKVDPRGEPDIIGVSSLKWIIKEAIAAGKIDAVAADWLTQRVAKCAHYSRPLTLGQMRAMGCEPSLKNAANV